ncbi:MAG: hypothetical protein K6G55_02845 [Selenomonadaceae bacterium]|nr:hypothetical protein [Selenomonadaceae bacterium]
MFKKIFIGMIILGVGILVGLAAAGYTTHKMVNEMIAEKQDDFKYYMTLSHEEQNEYILKHINEILAMVRQEAKTEQEKNELQTVVESEGNPVIKKAMIEFGRSVMAAGIVASETIIQGLSEEVKARYEDESEKLADRLKNYLTALEQGRNKPVE